VRVEVGLQDPPRTTHHGCAIRVLVGQRAEEQTQNEEACRDQREATSDVEARAHVPAKSGCSCSVARYQTTPGPSTSTSPTRTGANAFQRDSPSARQNV